MKRVKGQSLIGILVALAIFSILSQAVLTIAGTSYRFVAYNRARITARHLAQEKIEYIRNLPYDSVGTSGGIPSGALPQTEEVKRNGLKFTILLSIIFVDDPFDGTQGGTTPDTLGSDYKRVRVSVSWEGIESSQNNPVVLLSDIAPKGIETTEGGGTLSIIVFDANGDPVPEATLHIIQNSTTPNIDVTFQTANNGRFIYTGVPACVSCYQISVSKEGFSSERTHSTTEVANPTKPHQTVIEGQLSEISFSIDHVSTLNIATRKGRDDNFSDLRNVSFRLHGEKTIGTDADALPVFKYDEILSTNDIGILVLEDFEWDSYYFTPNPIGSWDISGTQPIQPVAVAPDDSQAFEISLVANTNNSLLLSFVNQQDDPIATVSATLTDGVFSASKSSGLTTDPDFGQVYFDNLNATSFTITATHSSFLDYSGTIPVLGDKIEKVILLPR